MSECQALDDAEPRKDRIHHSAFIPPAHGWLNKVDDRMDGKKKRPLGGKERVYS